MIKILDSYKRSNCIQDFQGGWGESNQKAPNEITCDVFYQPKYLIENEYLINDSKSKLKEIGTLFLDTGIGKTAYSVIGQGKVERIINSSPKEIKSIIEEAAGIKKLQANRIEAQKNLANIEINLDKVEFILNETRENKNKIEKQAELAQKYIDLRDEKNSLAKGIYITELEQKEKTLSENEDINMGMSVGTWYFA